MRMPRLEVFHRLLQKEWDRRLRARKAMGKKPSKMSIVPGTDEIGYVVLGNEMALHASALLELTMPSGFRKRYYVSRPVVA
jgi:hypothetical protein